MKHEDQAQASLVTLYCGTTVLDLMGGGTQGMSLTLEHRKSLRLRLHVGARAVLAQ